MLDICIYCEGGGWINRIDECPICCQILSMRVAEPNKFKGFMI